MIRNSLLALCAALHVCYAASPSTTITPAQSIASTGWQLIRTMPHGNAVVSPFSVWSALGMAHAGSAEETASEMAKALNAPNQNAFFASHSANLQQSFTQNKDTRIQLHSANRMWIQQDLSLDPLFVSTLQKQFSSSMGLLNFQKDPVGSRQTINRWIAHNTEERIKDLLPEGSIGPNSALVLTNALYMKAPWKNAFLTGATHDEAFQLGSKRLIQVPFMHQRISAMAGKVGAGLSSATVCEMPYGNGSLKMVIYIPDNVEGLNSVLSKLEHIKPNLTLRPVLISLPKWKAQQSLNLNEALKKLGMRKAFDRQNANFTGMRQDNDLFISQVVHQSFVEVNETGTEAAAATGVIMMYKTALPIDVEAPLAVRADRPFAWAIVETSTGTPLFTGVVRDPR